MGLFDRFKTPAGTPLLRELIERYALEKKAPAEPSLMGEWWEGRDQGRLVAFMERGKGLALYLGEPAEVTEIYLVRAAPGEPPAAAAPFRLGAQLENPLFDFAPLQLPRLSASVREVMIFDNRRGLSLALEASATRESIEADLKLAHAALQALEA